MPLERGAFSYTYVDKYEHLFFDIGAGRDRKNIGRYVNNQYDNILIHRIRFLPYVRRRTTKKTI